MKFFNFSPLWQKIIFNISINTLLWASFTQLIAYKFYTASLGLTLFAFIANLISYLFCLKFLIQYYLPQKKWARIDIFLFTFVLSLPVIGLCIFLYLIFKRKISTSILAIASSLYITLVVAQYRVSTQCENSASQTSFSLLSTSWNHIFLGPFSKDFHFFIAHFFSQNETNKCEMNHPIFNPILTYEMEIQVLLNEVKGKSQEQKLGIIIKALEKSLFYFKQFSEVPLQLNALTLMPLSGVHFYWLHQYYLMSIKQRGVKRYQERLGPLLNGVIDRLEYLNDTKAKAKPNQYQKDLSDLSKMNSLREKYYQMAL